MKRGIYRVESFEIPRGLRRSQSGAWPALAVKRRLYAGLDSSGALTFL